MSDPDPACFVADADVWAADLLVGGPARAALDLARAHEWITVVASEQLLEDAAAVIESTADRDLAESWRERATALVHTVSHPAGDHPALASAVAGNAAHLLSHDPELVSPQSNVAFQGRVDLSIRTPEAFVNLFDPASMYETVEGGDYPGPDTDPRA